jgi:GNAT superfamily N-acetyltransferase
MTANRHIGAIRRARPDEAPALNALTGRSTLHWGYEPAFLDWEPEALIVTTGLIAGSPVYVYEEDARVLGYHALLYKDPHWYLDKLFVEPDRIGTGLGKTLWLHAVATARDLGDHGAAARRRPKRRALLPRHGLHLARRASDHLARMEPADVPFQHPGQRDLIDTRIPNKP